MQNMTPKLRDLALFIMWSDHTGGEGGGGGLKLYHGPGSKDQDMEHASVSPHHHSILGWGFSS